MLVDMHTQEEKKPAKEVDVDQVRRDINKIITNEITTMERVKLFHIITDPGVRIKWLAELSGCIGLVVRGNE